ncbi:MAG TPA: VOC family protein [Bacillota bacterium]|nr:VOC family protein [Bacillota bacterium]
MGKIPGDIEKLGFEVAHIGINTAGDSQALAAAERFHFLFGWAVQSGKDSLYAEPKLEIMKNGGRGTHGHIAVATNDINAAQNYLESKGCVFAADSAKYNEQGKLIVIYLKDEIAGFAIHLLQK